MGLESFILACSCTEPLGRLAPYEGKRCCATRFTPFGRVVGGRREESRQEFEHVSGGGDRHVGVALPLARGGGAVCCK